MSFKERLFLISLLDKGIKNNDRYPKINLMLSEKPENNLTSFLELFLTDAIDGLCVH
jgi:hypothetical protein